MRKAFTLFIILISLQTFAQNLKMDGVLNVQLRNTGEITSEDDQIQGYYYFYNVEKVDKKTNNYSLSISDENLKQVNSINMVKSKQTVLVEAEYNGAAFAFLFYDYKTKMVELVTYDKNLKQTGTIKKVLEGKYNESLYGSVAGGGSSGYQFLVGIKNTGFLYYGFVTTKKYHYSVDCYDNNLKKLWNKQVDPGVKEMVIAENEFQTSTLIGSKITRKDGIMSKDMDYDLMVNDMKTGKELFKVEIKDDTYNLSSQKVVYDETTKNIMVFGEYFELKDKEAKSSALGYFYLVYDLTGKTVQRKFVSWIKDLSKFAHLDKSGKMERNARVFVHDIVRTKDGDIFVIGEQYKKAVSGGALAMKFLAAAAAAAAGGTSSSDVSNIQLTVMNMVVLQFSPSLDCKAIQVFEKEKNSVYLPKGAGFMSAKMLALYARSSGWFDYNYYQMLKDKNTFVFTYNNYLKEKGEKGKSVLSVAIYTPEKVFASDNIVLNKKSTTSRVGRAKSGYVMIAEYFIKEKNLDIRLEKLNY